MGNYVPKIAYDPEFDESLYKFKQAQIKRKGDEEIHQIQIDQEAAIFRTHIVDNLKGVSVLVDDSLPENDKRPVLIFDEHFVNGLDAKQVKDGFEFGGKKFKFDLERNIAICDESVDFPTDDDFNKWLSKSKRDAGKVHVDSMAFGTFDYDVKDFRYFKVPDNILSNSKFVHSDADYDKLDFFNRFIYVGNETDGSKIHIPEGIKDCHSMFANNHSLKTPPVIPESVRNCDHMFDGCTSLQYAPVIPKGVVTLSRYPNICDNCSDFVKRTLEWNYANRGFNLVNDQYITGKSVKVNEEKHLAKIPYFGSDTGTAYGTYDVCIGEGKDRKVMLRVDEQGKALIQYKKNGETVFRKAPLSDIIEKSEQQKKVWEQQTSKVLNKAQNIKDVQMDTQAGMGD